MSTAKLPTYFVSHGGGPWPYMREQMGDVYRELEASLSSIPHQLAEKPKAILVITAHWESQDVAISSGAKPGMIYDYGGFPAHTYSVKYEAPGSPQLAARIEELLKGRGIAAHQDQARGFDHGTFVPMAVMYPDADIPIVQISVLKGFDAEAHLQIGRALAPLRREGVLIVASGLSYHNLRQFGGPIGANASREFDGWLQETLLQRDFAARSKDLQSWESAPMAREAHPREEHLVPLMVAVGAAEAEPGECIYLEKTFMGGLTVSSFRFG